MVDPNSSAHSSANFPLLIKSLLVTPLQIAPDVEIVSDGLMRYSYRDFDARLKRLGNGLGALGVGKGSVVAVMDWDTHRYFECFFAVPMLGAVLHTVNIRLAPAQIAYTIDHAEDDVILVHADFVALLADVMPLVKRRVKLVLLRDDAAQTPASDFDFVTSYDAMLDTPADDFTFPDFDENTRATTFYTTGTTGDPKAVAYSHRQLVLHTMGLLAGLGPLETSNRLHRGDVYMPITPMFHVHAWGFPYAATLLGIKQVYAGRYIPANLLRLIADEGATFSHCVPTILQMLLAAPEAAKTDLTALKMLIGGASLPRGLAEAALARGINIYTGYGLSETCPVLTIAALDPNAERDIEDQIDARMKTGQPIPLVDLRIVDDAMRNEPHDGVSTGEVVARAPWLTAEYLKSPQASAALWKGGYLHTGDVGHIDPAGSLQITDRMKDVIKSGGEWLSSLALESLASGVEGVDEVAAIGIQDAKWGERPALLVVGKNDDQATIESDIRAAITAQIEAGGLSKWAMPEIIRFVDEIAKTSVGKIDKKRLRAEFI
ncbi:long-chain-fatty-acid--CoA ligase [Alphaproteobacteria bacterium]|nr:long-chain-fatty-acid--CoA ligase [Alphaproteobacteria bacterium]